MITSSKRKVATPWSKLSWTSLLANPGALARTWVITMRTMIMISRMEMIMVLIFCPALVHLPDPGDSGLGILAVVPASPGPQLHPESHDRGKAQEQQPLLKRFHFSVSFDF